MTTEGVAGADPEDRGERPGAAVRRPAWAAHAEGVTRRFECDELEGTGSHSIAGSPWSGHRPFVHDLLGWWRPRGRIVDLGVHWGCSTFAFAQASKDHGLPVEIVGVDTFVGDEHSGRYGEEVFGFVTRCARVKYSDVRIRIERRTFREALPTVADGSADIIHIDGCHEYGQVREDLESWLPKLVPHGLILLHDISTAGRYGSERFWRDVAAEHPSLEFRHSWGLGLLFPKGDRLYRELIRAGLPFWLDWYRAHDYRRRGQMVTQRVTGEGDGGESADAELPPEPAPPARDPVESWRYRERAELVGRVARQLGLGARRLKILLLGPEAPGQILELLLALESASVTVLGRLPCKGALFHSLSRTCVQWTDPADQLPAEHFDLVVSFAMLERARDPLGLFDAAARCVRPEGALVLTSPSLFWCAVEARRAGDPFWRPPPVVLERGLLADCVRRGLRVRARGRFMFAPRSVLAQGGLAAGAQGWVDRLLDRVPVIRRALINRYFIVTRGASPPSPASR